MKRLSRILVISMVLSLLVVAISPSLVGAAAAGPVKVTDQVPIYDVNEEDGVVTIGERNVDLLIYPNEPICQVVSMKMTIDLDIYTWDGTAPVDHLANIKVNERLTGEVYIDVWFPDSEDGGLTIDEGVVNGHVVFDWKIKPYSDEIPDEIRDNLKGKYNLWFEDGVELPRSTRVGEFPFIDW